jgi:uncharacterized membrane protein YkoI
MIRKNALLMAAALTAFVLVLIGGIAGKLSSVASAAEGQPSSPSATVDEAALAAVMQEREGAYRQLIDQANQLLAVTAEAPAAPTYPVSADTAVAIVLTTVRGGELQQPPELVDYMGAAAYEVSLVQGLVYVDANTGKILANGAIPQVVVVEDNSGGNQDGSSSSSGYSDDDGDHEDEHEDGDD